MNILSHLQIEKHNLTIIAVDGSAVKPFVVDCIVSVSGERYDVVLHASTDQNTSKISECVEFN